MDSFKVVKAEEILYNQFEAFISFLLTDMGIGYHNMDRIVFYESKGKIDETQKLKLKTFYDLLEESNRNYVIFYSKLPLDIKKNLFNYNQEKLLEEELKQKKELLEKKLEMKKELLLLDEKLLEAELMEKKLLKMQLLEKKLGITQFLEMQLVMQSPVEYRLKCDFEVFDKLMSCSVKFEKRMLIEAYKFLSKIFYQQFSKEQKMDLDEGKWIEGYNDATHCYVKWLNYGKKSYIMIKQMRTFWNSFRSYFLAGVSEE